ncbi:transmembrane protein 47-like isoform X2 [Tachypleus tridentatus]|uniref:transmembrane protein 47-like isoform X2 n=1 Tax=Tachypleus tridentatus TaxID=6853 RepID=UPI003FD58013
MMTERGHQDARTSMMTTVHYFQEEESECCFTSKLCRYCDLIQVISFICGLIVILLMLLCLASSNWLTADKFRQGLWEHCVDEDAPLPLPFHLKAKPVYIQGSAALCVVTLLCDVCATMLTGIGLCIKEPARKCKLYRVSLYVMVCSLSCILIALVVYPASFASEIEESNRQVWEFGWAYGVGWGAAIFLFGTIILLLCDKEAGGMYHMQRSIHNESRA